MSVPETVHAYMDGARPRLLGGYLKAGGRDAESCTAVARAIAGLMHEGGLTPRVVEVIPLPRRDDGVMRACGALRPAPLAAHGVEWGAHFVCVHEGTAYDPIAPRPLPLDLYLLEIFDGLCTTQTAVPEEEIRDFIRFRG
jgi:hypothetical protein